MDEKRREQTFDPVERPKHYNVDPSGIECIELAELMRFAPGNAIKYVWRAGLKDSDSDLQDLNKALWYIRRTLEHDQDRVEQTHLMAANRREIVAKVVKHRAESIRGVLEHLVQAENMPDPRERLTLHKLALLELQHYIMLKEQGGAR